MLFYACLWRLYVSMIFRSVEIRAIQHYKRSKSRSYYRLMLICMLCSVTMLLFLRNGAGLLRFRILKPIENCILMLYATPTAFYFGHNCWIPFGLHRKITIWKDLFKTVIRYNPIMEYSALLNVFYDSKSEVWAPTEPYPTNNKTIYN